MSTEGVEPFTRKDTTHANPAHRPTHKQYEQYVRLVQHFRDAQWDNARLHDLSPFKVVDPGFNAILIRSCIDLAALADDLDEPEIAARSREFAARGLTGMKTLWSHARGQYLCFDRASGEAVDSPSIGGLLAVFAPIPAPRAAALAARLGTLGEAARFMVPSHDPASADFESLRYWRGPVWLIVNYMIADGLARAGHVAEADRIVTDSVRLIEESGFAEYYDPNNAEPCGGGSFTWTAAMVVEFLTPHSRPRDTAR